MPRHRGFGRAERPVQAAAPAIEAGPSAPATLYADRRFRGVRRAARRPSRPAAGCRCRLPLRLPVFAGPPAVPSVPVIPPCPLPVRSARPCVVSTHTIGQHTLQVATQRAPRQGSQNFAAPLAQVGGQFPYLRWDSVWQAERTANFCARASPAPSASLTRRPLVGTGFACCPQWCVWR